MSMVSVCRMLLVGRGNWGIGIFCIFVMKFFCCFFGYFVGNV